MGKYDQQILALLKNKDQTDRELANIILGKEKPQSPINSACRSLCDRGYIKRSEIPIYNSLVNGKNSCDKVITEKAPKQELQEDIAKEILKQDLILKGWTIDHFALGHKHGADIVARKEDQRWIIEVKGCGSGNPMRVNYFLSVFGEILQRMNDPVAKYSIAVPDIEQYRKLWNKLPVLAKERTTVSIIFVKEDNSIEYPAD